MHLTRWILQILTLFAVLSTWETGFTKEQCLELFPKNSKFEYNHLMHKARNDLMNYKDDLIIHFDFHNGGNTTLWYKGKRYESEGRPPFYVNTFFRKSRSLSAGVAVVFKNPPKDTEAKIEQAFNGLSRLSQRTCAQAMCAILNSAGLTHKNVSAIRPSTLLKRFLEMSQLENSRETLEVIELTRSVEELFETMEATELTYKYGVMGTTAFVGGATVSVTTIVSILNAVFF